MHSVFVLWCLFGAFLVKTVKEDLQRVGVTEEDGRDGGRCSAVVTPHRRPRKPEGWSISSQGEKMDRGPDRRDEGWSMKSRQTGVVRCDGSGETQTLTERERAYSQNQFCCRLCTAVCLASVLAACYSTMRCLQWTRKSSCVFLLACKAVKQPCWQGCEKKWDFQSLFSS